MNIGTRISDTSIFSATFACKERKSWKIGEEIFLKIWKKWRSESKRKSSYEEKNELKKNQNEEKKVIKIEK